MTTTLAAAGVAAVVVPGTGPASLAGTTLAGGAVLALLGGLALWVRRATSASVPCPGAATRRRARDDVRRVPGDPS